MSKTDGMAEEIAEDLLYRTGQAILTGDFGWLDDCFALPQMLETLEGRRLVETEEQVHAVFAGVRRFHKELGVTDIVRTTVSCEYLKPDLIGSMHVTCLLRKDRNLLRAPYPCYSILRNFGDDWKIVSTTYAILDAPELNAVLSTNGIELSS